MDHSFASEGERIFSLNFHCIHLAGG